MKTKRSSPVRSRQRRPKSASSSEASEASTLAAFEPFAPQFTKAQLQQMRIIEAAVTSFANRGLAGTTYTTLAEDCGISRPLIHHYFPTLDSLFLMAAKSMRARHLEYTLQQVQATHSGEAQLREYASASFGWLEKNPDQAKFWLLYYYQCALGGQIAVEHEELIKAGEKRIDQILQLIDSQGKKLHDRARLAKMIQIIIIGGTISALTESHIMTFARAKDLTLRAVDAALNSK